MAKDMYDAKNSKMMGGYYGSSSNGDDSFFPKEAKVMKMKCPSQIKKGFDYPDTASAIYEDQEAQVRDASRSGAKADRRS